MKYCFNYNKDTEHAKYINKADEWTIEYNPKDDTLLEFLDLHKDKRINLYFKELVSEELLYELTNKYNNLYLKLNTKLFYQEDIKYEFNFFFDELISDWDTFIGLLNYGVTDVYIVENLGFELDKVAEMAASHNVQVRVYPNVAQSKWGSTPAFKKFFIRPEDIDTYNKYIDIIEFYDGDKQLDTYYEIYAIDKEWFGKLNEIIKDFNLDIDNRYIIPRFAQRRMTCSKKCLKGSICTRCDEIEKLANTLKESDLIVWNEK